MLAQLPHLKTVNLGSCCKPPPAGGLAKVLLELAALTSLRTLQLSTWIMALPQDAPAQQTPSQLASPASGQPSPAAAAQQTSVGNLQSSNSGQHSAAAGHQAASSATAQQTSSGCCRSPPGYDIALPCEVAAIASLRELIINTCAEVSTPHARRLQLPPALMGMPSLVRLELHGFLPAVHHLRGLHRLQHLSISDSQHNADVLKAAGAALLSLPRLTSLHVLLPPPQAGPFAGLEPATAAVGAAVVQLLETLCAAAAETMPTAAGTAAGQPADGSAQEHSRPADSPTASSTGGAAGATRQLDPAAANAATAAAARLRLAPPCKLLSLRLRAAAGLYHLPTKFAAACAGLQELDLPCSRLTVEAAAVLGGLTGLTFLCLADSRLAEWPSSWAGLTRLQVSLHHRSSSVWHN